MILLSGCSDAQLITEDSQNDGGQNDQTARMILPCMILLSGCSSAQLIVQRPLPRAAAGKYL
jgi:hypothetical protein